VLAMRYADDLVEYCLANGSEPVFTNHVVPIDASAYVLQELAYLQGNRQLAELCGLLGKPAVDAYLLIAKSLEWWLNHPEGLPDNLKEHARAIHAYPHLLQADQRKIMKPALVLEANGGKFMGVQDTVAKAAYDFVNDGFADNNDAETWKEPNALGAFAWYLGKCYMSGDFKSGETVEVKGRSVPLVDLVQSSESGATCSFDAFVSQLARSFPADGEGFTGIDLKVSPRSFELHVGTDQGKRKSASVTALKPAILHCLDGHMIINLALELSKEGVDQLFPNHDCIMVPLDAVDIALKLYPKAHYAAVRETDGDVLRFIAEYRVEQLLNAKPPSRAAKGRVTEWKRMLKAARKAAEMTTGGLLFEGEAGERQTVEDLMALVHETAFVVGG